MSRVLEWVQSVAAPWGYVLIGGLALAESAAFVGLVIPGEAALLLGGFLAQRGQLGLPVMVLAAVLGGGGRGLDRLRDRPDGGAAAAAQPAGPAGG